jgi:acyl-CoA thioester hydrolase
MPGTGNAGRVRLTSRLAGQAARLHASNYPLRFAYRSLFGDMDANRHLNNGAIGRVFEEGRADLNRRVFGPTTAEPTNEVSLLLATITVDFLAQSRYPGAVEVATAVTQIGGTSYVLAQAAFQNSACIALASSVMVTAADGRPVPLAEAERDALAELMLAGGD